MFTCMNECADTYTVIYIYICVRTLDSLDYIYVQIKLYTCILVYIDRCARTHTHLHVYTYNYIHVCMLMCTHAFICAYTEYRYTHLLTYSCNAEVQLHANRNWCTSDLVHARGAGGGAPLGVGGGSAGQDFFGFRCLSSYSHTVTTRDRKKAGLSTASFAAVAAGPEPNHLKTLTRNIKNAFGAEPWQGKHAGLISWFESFATVGVQYFPVYRL